MSVIKRRSAPSSASFPPPPPAPVELPFTGLTYARVAVDAADNVYVADSSRVLKLAPGRAPGPAAVHRPAVPRRCGGGQRRQRLCRRHQQRPGAQTTGRIAHPGRAPVHRRLPPLRCCGRHRRQRVRQQPNVPQPQKPGAQATGRVAHPGRAAIHRPRWRSDARRCGGGHRRQRLHRGQQARAQTTGRVEHPGRAAVHRP